MNSSEPPLESTERASVDVHEARRGLGVKRCASPLLVAMRRVFKRPASRDRKECDKRLRKLYDEAPDKFMARMATLEAAQARGEGRKANKGTPVQDKSQPADQTAERLRELIARTLKEAGGESDGDARDGPG